MSGLTRKPDGFVTIDQRVSFTWRERLRLLLGRELVVRSHVQIWFPEPGRERLDAETTTRAVVEPLFRTLRPRDLAALHSLTRTRETALKQERACDVAGCGRAAVAVRADLGGTERHLCADCSGRWARGERLVDITNRAATASHG